MLLSVVIPVYQEVENIQPLYDRLMECLPAVDREYEIVIVNDGSTDGTGEKLDRLAAENPKLKVLHLRRNYGQTAALMAGIQSAAGDVIVPLDGDLQNDPADIPNLLAKLDEGYDVVSGWRKAREDAAVTRLLPSKVANWLISSIFGVKLHDYGCTLKAYRREVIDNLRLYGEMHRYIPIYAAWEGARITEIPVSHNARRFGRSKYGLGRIFRVALDIVLLYFMDRAFDRPIQFFGKLAGGAWGLAFVALAWAMWMKLEGIRDFVQSPLPLVGIGLGLAGIIFVLMGVLAEMQMRIYFESQGRTHYTVRKSINVGP
ncbi:MAG: glycosyltransferase family 2 protein [Actinomycetota bacterium]